MSTQASCIATRPSLFEALRRRVAGLWRQARQRAEAARAHALLRQMSARDLADLGIGADQVDWFCHGQDR
jgi:uncharacterized protein YjiS (DUF1127 family)